MLVDIVIPVINEENAIANTLQTILNNSSGKIGEILVIDGGSTDRTENIVNSFQKAKFIRAPHKGRSKQMNFGASLCKNEIIYFLHADTLPPKDFDNSIIESVLLGYASGCFRMQFDNPHLLLKFSGWLTRFNSSWCRGGDQSLFVTKMVFDKSGSFNENLIIYEDNEILKRIRKISKFRVIQKDIITSARRFEENGIFTLQMIFLKIHLLYRLGLPHDKLVSYYRRSVKGN